jgi:hypothetical protein
VVARTPFGKAVTATCNRRDGRALAAIGVLDGNCLVLVAVDADNRLGEDVIVMLVVFFGWPELGLGSG